MMKDDCGSCCIFSICSLSLFLLLCAYHMHAPFNSFVRLLPCFFFFFQKRPFAIIVAGFDRPHLLSHDCSVCAVSATSSEECLLYAVYTFSSTALPETFNSAQLACVHGLVSISCKLTLSAVFYMLLLFTLSYLFSTVFLRLAYLCHFLTHRWLEATMTPWLGVTLINFHHGDLDSVPVTSVSIR